MRDLSAFTDEPLNSLERLRDELMRDQASQLFVSAIAQAIAIHVVRNYESNRSISRHGSQAATTAMTHLAVQEALNGKAVERSATNNITRR